MVYLVLHSAVHGTGRDFVFGISLTLPSDFYPFIQLLAADIRLADLMKKLNEMESNISSLNRRIMLLEVSPKQS